MNVMRYVLGYMQPIKKYQHFDIKQKRRNVYLNNTATNTIPVWEKVLLTPRETSAYSNIGINKMG